MRIVELGDNSAAGYCGRLFALAGHEVIRVDSMDAGPMDHSALALDIYLHSDKKRLTLNYQSPAGRQVLSDLIDHADVLVADLLPQDLDRLNWPVLGESNRKLIRASISPFGLSGPYRDWKGWGPVLLAMGGTTELIGDPGREPLSLPGNIVEYQAGQYAYIAICAHLLHSARGAHTIEVSLLETVLSPSQFTTVLWTCNGVIRTRYGNAWSNLHPIAMYPCRDGWFLVNVVPDFWPAFTRMLGREELMQDPRFATSQARVENRQALDSIIIERLADSTMAEITELGQRHFRVPTGGALTFPELLAHEHLTARQFFREVRLRGEGVLRVPGSAYRYVNPEGWADNPPSTGLWQARGNVEDGDARSA
ncbi:MAG: CoA transferase [Pseudomonadales bacterium]|nr:CoA transferase [Pseudomonadales bacterium]